MINKSLSIAVQMISLPVSKAQTKGEINWSPWWKHVEIKKQAVLGSGKPFGLGKADEVYIQNLQKNSDMLSKGEKKTTIINRNSSLEPCPAHIFGKPCTFTCSKFKEFPDGHGSQTSNQIVSETQQIWGVSLNGGIPKMDGLMENPIKIWDDLGVPLFLDFHPYKFWPSKTLRPKVGRSLAKVTHLNV